MSGQEQKAIVRQLRAALENGNLNYMEVATKKDGPKKWFTATTFGLS